MKSKILLLMMVCSFSYCSEYKQPMTARDAYETAEERLITNGMNLLGTVSDRIRFAANMGEVETVVIVEPTEERYVTHVLKVLIKRGYTTFGTLNNGKVVWITINWAHPK